MDFTLSEKQKQRWQEDHLFEGYEWDILITYDHHSTLSQIEVETRHWRDTFNYNPNTKLIINPSDQSWCYGYLTDWQGVVHELPQFTHPKALVYHLNNNFIKKHPLCTSND